ncbi:neprilysin-2 [Rhipicephalus sanguineus]|uniref:neprilysin-2 n=1 Tax=Rhipicephalus sanguineus TaxID=34632 RepID=UPI0020C3F37A|nr:neprilysin-2 [Rhipicephalus sanguineus]
MLRYLLKSDTDPCKDFYKYVCDQWPSQQPPSVSYTGADGALAADIEARMHAFLDGPGMSSIQPLFTFWTNCNNQGSVPQDRVLSHVRALGLELPGSRAASSPERLMVLAVTLAQEFGLFALLTVELDSDPEGKAQHVVAVDEPELAWGRMKPPLVTAEDTTQWNMLMRVAQPLALLLLSDLSTVQSVAHSFARITMAMTNVSVANRHISDRMALYEMHSYQELNRLDPLLNGLFGSSQDLRPSSRLLVKAPRFVELVYALLATDREALHQYMVILALLHLAPFLDVPDASSAFLSSLTGEDVTWGTPPRWRVCLRLAERTLPNLMQVAYEQIFKGSPIFDEVMGDIMVDEVRNGLVEFIDSLNILDAWSKIIAKIKVRDTKVYTFYPIVLADPKNLNAYVKKLEQSVTWDGDIMEYYIQLRGFLAQMKERDETLNFFLPRWKHSIFDPECVYYPRRDVVYVPVGFFNLTVPTSPGERMFHVPRAGPRLVGCFFRVVMENTGLYKPEGLWWTEATRAAFQESVACIEDKHNQMILQDGGIDLHDVSRRPNLQGLSDLEDNVGVRISVKVFNDRLFTNRYLNRDYRLPGVEHLSSQQLFFIYLARSHCEVPSVAKSLEDIRCSYKSKGKYRTNLPLSNNHEFADAFQCAPGTVMNPTTQCSVWS